MKKLIRTTWAVGTSIEYFKENKNKMVALGWYATDEEESCNHRYRKTKNRLLKVCYVPATSARLPRVLFSFLMWPLTVLMKQTRQVRHAIEQSILLRCLWL